MLIAHIADLHVSGDGRPVHDLVDTDAATRAVVAAVAALDPQPDVVLVTGDLTHAGEPGAAERARALLAPLRPPVFVCPGNHDRRGQLRTAFGRRADDADDDWMCYVVEEFPVRLIALDSVVDDPFSAALPPAQIAWLAARLAEAPDRPTAIFLHHPPFDTGISWLDEMRIAVGRDELGALFARHRNVRAVLCGHLHQPMRGTWFGTPVFAGPSVMNRVAFTGRLPDGSPTVEVVAPPGFVLHRVGASDWQSDICFLNGHVEVWAPSLPDPWADS